MIVLDIETSGGKMNPCEYGIWQIGAIEFENPENYFFQECRIDETDKIQEEALKITGKTEEELRDSNKQPQKQLLGNFFSWIKKVKYKSIAAHNTPFDYGFVCVKANIYSLEIPFNHRSLDLHTLAQSKYFQLNNKFLMRNGEKFFGMGLSSVLEFCGLKDERIKIKDNKIIKEGKNHSALEDAKLEAECFSRLLAGKSLLEEFEKIPIPEYLKN